MPKVSGYIFRDGQEVAETKQCVHCGRQWIWKTGSGRKRGWCLACGGITCGTARCHTCLPFERKLDLYEKGLISSL